MVCSFATPTPTATGACFETWMFLQPREDVFRCSWKEKHAELLHPPTSSPSLWRRSSSPLLQPADGVEHGMHALIVRVCKTLVRTISRCVFHLKGDSLKNEARKLSTAAQRGSGVWGGSQWKCFRNRTTQSTISAVQRVKLAKRTRRYQDEATGAKTTPISNPVHGSPRMDLDKVLAGYSYRQPSYYRALLASSCLMLQTFFFGAWDI